MRTASSQENFNDGSLPCLAFLAIVAIGSWRLRGLGMRCRQLSADLRHMSANLRLASADLRRFRAERDRALGDYQRLREDNAHLTALLVQAGFTVRAPRLQDDDDGVDPDELFIPEDFADAPAARSTPPPTWRAGAASEARRLVDEMLEYV
jgi:hypothetical protein